MTPQAKFAATRREMSDALIERDTEVDAVLTAMIARQHCLFVGVPGTAKSMLLDSVMRWMNGTTFSILMTKFTTPEEVFGPISVAGLKMDQYRRITTGKLPEANLCFCDEIFKSSSAILNTMLRILNERMFDHGDGKGPQPVPLRLCVAASNEWPQSNDGQKELGALFDRFLLRKTVKPIVSAAGRERLLWGGDHTPKLSTSISPAELDRASNEAAALPWSDEAKDALGTILRELAKEGIQPGDRRQYQSVIAAKGFAYLNGASRVEPDHLEILSHVLWDDPAEQPEKCAAIVSRVANPVGMAVNSLLLECEQILASTDTKQLAQAAAATSKLGEIAKRLGSLVGANGRAAKAQAYVKSEIRKIKLASIEAI